VHRSHPELDADLSGLYEWQGVSLIEVPAVEEAPCDFLEADPPLPTRPGKPQPPILGAAQSSSLGDPGRHTPIVPR
jgi:hypothetical protein